MNEPTRTVHVRISGHVQGVGFRVWVEYAALARDIEGWVRNRRDGSVEAVFSGPAEDVASMIAACREGPRAARVEAVEAREGDAAAELMPRLAGERFSMLPTC